MIIIGVRCTETLIISTSIENFLTGNRFGFKETMVLVKKFNYFLRSKRPNPPNGCDHTDILCTRFLFVRQTLHGEYRVKGR